MLTTAPDTGRPCFSPADPPNSVTHERPPDFALHTNARQVRIRVQSKAGRGSCHGVASASVGDSREARTAG
ncbi:hypothetical protein CS0771_14590 [Catellatospora sp. IY07-71]|nr:hypothetical protein CS0771_14590 [Catellatospora sp. IY07-71]